MHDTDIMIVVHSNCALNEESCTLKRKFISNLIESIKVGHNPRIGLFECGEKYDAIKLSDNSLNDIVENNKLTQQNRNDLFFNKIQTRLQCLNEPKVSAKQCLDEVMIRFDNLERSGTRKIVLYIQMCASACCLESKLQNDNIELIVVNVDDFTKANDIKSRLIQNICHPSESESGSDSSEESEESESDENSVEMIGELLKLNSVNSKHPTSKPFVQRFSRRQRRSKRHYSENSDDSEESS